MLTVCRRMQIFLDTQKQRVMFCDVLKREQKRHTLRSRKAM